MKIVDYDTFIRLPKGSIFAPYEPCFIHEPFEIKTDKGDEYEMFGEKLYSFNGVECVFPSFGDIDDYPYDYGTYETEIFSYDGAACDYMDYKMFAVLEKDEVISVIGELLEALNGCETNKKIDRIMKMIKKAFIREK